MTIELPEQELWFKVLDKARAGADACCQRFGRDMQHDFPLDFASWLVIQYGMDPQLADDYVTAWEKTH